MYGTFFFRQTIIRQCYFKPFLFYFAVFTLNTMTLSLSRSIVISLLVPLSIPCRVDTVTDDKEGEDETEVEVKSRRSTANTGSNFRDMLKR